MSTKNHIVQPSGKVVKKKVDPSSCFLDKIWTNARNAKKFSLLVFLFENGAEESKKNLKDFKKATKDRIENM